MELEFIFRHTSFKHGIAEADIRHAFMNPCYDGLIEEYPTENNRYIRIGFDTGGHLLEIMYNEYEDYVCIFHAMKCRNMFLSLLEV